MYEYYIEELDENIEMLHFVSSGDYIILNGDRHIINTITHRENFRPTLSVKKKLKAKRFKKPSLEEVDAFANDSNLTASGFFDYYESNGWKAGKNPMKDWKSALRGWSKRQYSTGTPSSLNNPYDTDW